MKTIYKYQFPIEDNFEIEFPDGYEIIYVGLQNNIPTLWAIVPLQTEMTVTHRFSVRGTGHPFETEGDYIATFFQEPYVWHLFKQLK